MNGFPPVSAMCLTYGRPHLLEEAIQSFLLQDYAGPKELVILNDFADQTLVCDHGDVRIINSSERFATVGEKRNACATLARHDILFVWDDDDIYLPHRLSYSVARLDQQRGFYKPSKAWVLNGETLTGPKSNLFHSGACFTRELFERAGMYPHIGSGQDLEFELAVERLLKGRKNDNRIPPAELFYIYRWSGTSSYHLSAYGRDRPGMCGNARVEEFVQKELRAKRLPAGNVVLRPRWKQDYGRLVATLLDLDRATREVESG